MKRLAILLMNIWLGMHIGFHIAAHHFFVQLGALNNGKMLAGHIAGILFSTVNYFGLFAWLFAWITQYRSRTMHGQNGMMTWISLLLVLLAVNQFLFTPVIAALKVQQTNWLSSLIGGSFGMWHGMSQLLYMMIGLLGLVVSIRVLRCVER